MSALAEQEPLLSKLADILVEIRRLGRASVGAQASADACLSEVKSLTSAQHATFAQLAQALKHLAPGGNANVDRAQGRLSVPALLTLLPLFDAIDAAVQQVRQQASPESAASPLGLTERLRSGLRRLRGAALDPTDTQQSVRHGLEMIQAEARTALRRLGVEIDERVGVALDPERHRVVQVHPNDSMTRVVLQVLRPGYALDSTCVREADVVAARPVS